MSTDSTAVATAPAPRFFHGRVPGLLLAAALALVSMWLAGMPAVKAMGLGVLSLAIVLGMALGNALPAPWLTPAHAGIDFAKSRLLRTGIVLYGLRVTFQDITSIGTAGLVIDVIVVGGIFLLAVVLGTRMFKLDRETSMLIGAGSAVCGAAAVLAAEPVVRAEPHKATVAVATVVVFGTLSMFLYPVLYPYLGMDAHAYGLYVGSTVHEVAQVVVAGDAVSADSAATAVIVKMLRVMLLAPFLLILSAWLARRGNGGDKRGIQVPWFAVLFIVMSGINSLDVLPPALVAGLVQLDNLLLAMAMAALGIRTQARAIVQAGVRPLLLAATLFVVLIAGGYALNVGVTALLGTA